MNNNTRIVSLALAGLAAGGAIWYLLGTEQGKSLRHNLANSAKELGNDIKHRMSDRWNEMSGKTTDLASNVVNRTNVDQTPS